MLDAEGQSLAYVYGVADDPTVGKTLTLDEARRRPARNSKQTALAATWAGVAIGRRGFGHRSPTPSLAIFLRDSSVIAGPIAFSSTTDRSCFDCLSGRPIPDIGFGIFPMREQ